MTLEELPTTKYATFETWRNLGYGVIKGSKAFWVDGISYFTEFQVNSFATWASLEKPKFNNTEPKVEGWDDDIPF